MGRFVGCLWVCVFAAGIAASSQNAVIYGVLYGTRGKPLPGVTVVLENKALGIVRHTVTAGDGTFAFTEVPPADNYQVTAKHEHFTLDSRAGIVVNVGDERIVALQDPDAAVYGKVYAADRQTPLAGITVLLENHALGFSSSAVTGSDGSYRFDEVQPGKSYQLTAKSGDRIVDTRMGIRLHRYDERVVLPPLVDKAARKPAAKLTTAAAHER